MMTLVVFDFSGTLSLEAPAFGRPDHLPAVLRESGLADLGIESAGVFWNEVVNPTWAEGSTTPIGYRGIMARRIRERCDVRLGDRVGDRIDAAVSRFVAAYLGQSRIDRRWQALLSALTVHPDVQVLVATDHYAEATECILNNLRDWRLPAVAIRNVPTPLPSPPPILVANSADLGAPKAARAFWDEVRRCLSGEVAQVAVVDDFGFNEQTGDSYAAREKVAERMARTASLLEEVFPSPVKILPFMIDPAAPAGVQEAAIRDVDEQIRALLPDEWGDAPSLSARGSERLRSGGSGLQSPREPLACKRKPDLIYPCPWAYTLIGADADGLRRAVSDIVGERVHTVTLSRTSAGGKYHSLNLALEVRDETERLGLYDAFRRHPAVRLVL